MPWAQTQWFISSFIFAHICLCPCVCLLLIPLFFQPACLPWDPAFPPPHLPLSAPYTHPRVHAYTQSTCKWAQRVWLFCCTHCYSAWCSLHLATVSFAGANNPVCSRPCTEVSELSVNNLHAVSAGFRTLCWCITGSHRKWPDTHTCFLSTKITLRQAQWEFQADRPAALCLMRTNRVCAGRVGALFFLSETGMNNSRACHNTPRVKFHIFTALP